MSYFHKFCDIVGPMLCSSADWPDSLPWVEGRESLSLLPCCCFSPYLLRFSYQKLLGLAVNHLVFDRMIRTFAANLHGLAAEHPYFTEGIVSWTSHSVNLATFTPRATQPRAWIHGSPRSHTQLAINPTEWENLLNLTWIFLLPPILP